MVRRSAEKISIEFAGQKMELLADRALWWPGRKSLIVADVHLGKGASFRSLGVPVPAGSSDKDLQRLSGLIEKTRAGRLLVLGDFLHAKSGRQREVMASITNWRNKHADVKMILVRGNHDRAAGSVPVEWNVHEVSEPYLDGKIFLSHFPDCQDCEPLICGHLHPAYSIRDFDGSMVRVPCFVMDRQQMILPAFGSFTGGYGVYPAEGRRIFAVLGQTLAEIRE